MAKRVDGWTFTKWPKFHLQFVRMLPCLPVFAAEKSVSFCHIFKNHLQTLALHTGTNA